MKFKKELYYIVPLVNMRSIIQHGILCHNLASKIAHYTIAMDEIQEIRENKTIKKIKLHEYVNLYFNPRNPMMYKRRDQYSHICVLGISDAVLQIPSVFVSDTNAARYYVQFLKPEQGLMTFNFNEIYSKNWNHPDSEEKYRLKGVICAEVLVPRKVEYNMINRAYVANVTVKEKLQSLNFQKEIKIEPDMFFQK